MFPCIAFHPFAGSLSRFVAPFPSLLSGWFGLNGFESSAFLGLSAAFSNPLGSGALMWLRSFMLQIVSMNSLSYLLALFLIPSGGSPKASSGSMFHVVTPGRPFKVCDLVVLFVTILVVNLSQTVGVWYEGLGNQSMDTTVALLTVYLYHGIEVPTRLLGEGQQSWPPTQCPNLASVTDLIQLISSFYGFPLFIHTVCIVTTFLHTLLLFGVFIYPPLEAVLSNLLMVLCFPCAL